MRTCRACSTTRPLTDFPRNAEKPQGLAAICKECQRIVSREHYRLHRERYISRARARNAINGLEIRELIATLKRSPCADCTQQYPRHVVQFDHVRGVKRFNVSRGRRLSVARILAEVAKCDLVCANCHAIRTYNRMVARR